MSDNTEDRKLPAAHLGGTTSQRRRANEIVAETLGIYALSTPRDDPGALFGFECALLAIMRGDRQAVIDAAAREYDRAQS